ncbi:uncharacterized protein LOC132628664 [Lycium barbarum]|uniref:uncharacterized protein LOC132628664 n=1 Tax=Lycium barbarum TaxID=112863 RepID=UPI00293E3137|nr:uncharacterized protein LOC132628664 [Lycium barbarum]
MASNLEGSSVKPLWEELQVLSTRLKGPWGVIGEFNAITSPEEKHGGACYNMQKSVFMGPSTLGATTGGTQEQSGKDSIDCSLMKNVRVDTVKYFKFLNIWCNHKDFIDIVKDAWTINTQGTAMWKLHNKMKAVATKLSSWSREAFGDIFKDDEIYRQKAKARWLQDGDKNTSYFHKVIKDRRRKLNIQSIQDNEGHKIEGHQNIATTTIKHFEGLFSYQEVKGSFRILDIVPKLVTEEMNAILTAIPTPQEVRQAIKDIDPDSSPGLDGFGAKLFQVCIDIILPEVHGAIKEFFEGAPVPRHVSNNWYSIVLNGTGNGFFKSNRGLRQGDPLSPALFIICAELISSMLNNLVLDENFTGYYRPKKGSIITHLAFADDIILFTSGQMINKHKSCVAFSLKANMDLMHRSITRRIHSWHSKFVSIRGKITLIKHVLLAMLVHLLAAMKPPKGTFEQIEAAIARFLWNNNENVNKYHWSKWESMCLPYEEGGVGFRCLRDVSKSFIAKQWWSIRTKESLWKDYIMAKYCTRIRSQMENNITWQIGQGQVSFWFNNWTREGALYKLLPDDVIPNNIKLNEVHDNGTWHWNRAGYRVPWAVRLAIQNVTSNFTHGKEDKSIWIPNLEGKFSISSAWNLLRKKVVGD